MLTFSRKSVLFFYAQNLWITLWMNLPHECCKPSIQAIRIRQHKKYTDKNT